jgi:hypothetical protein
MKRRLGIVGVGTAGLVSAGHFCTWLDNTWEIYSIYDPKINSLGIGESTNGNFNAVLEESMDFTIEEHMHELDGTEKRGTKF